MIVKICNESSFARFYILRVGYHSHLKVIEREKVNSK